MQREINNICLARSKWKNKFFSKSIWSSIFNIYFLKFTKKFKKILYSRSSSIPKCFNNSKIYIHKGKSFNKIVINNNNVGYKFGEFSYTRKPFFFLKKEVKKATRR